jgi:hypothetical protein
MMACIPYDNYILVTENHKSADGTKEIFANIPRNIKHISDIAWQAGISDADKEKVDNFLKEYLHLED